MIYIYSLTDPTTKDVFYIGQTQNLNKRYSGHISAAQTKRYNHKCCLHIQKLLDINLKPVMEVVDIVEKEHLEFFEKFWISQFISWGFKLDNMTDGGIGNKNQIFSQASIKKRADKLRNIPRTEEYKKSLSKTLLSKNITRSEQSKRKASASSKAHHGVGVIQLSENGEVLKRFPSIIDAAEFVWRVNLKNKPNRVKETQIAAQIGTVIRGVRKTARGFKWIRNEDIV